MKRILFVFSTLFITLSFMTGCLQRTELNELGMVAGLGIDKEENGYTVTAQILNPAALANNSGSTPVYSLKATGQSMSEAFSRIDQMSTTTLFLAHLDVIVVNEAMAEAGINPVLNFALRHTDIRPDINIAVAKGTSANHILNVLPDAYNPPVASLDVSTNMAFEDTSRLVDINLFETIDMVNSPGIQLVLNAVRVHHETDENQSEEEDGKSDNTQAITSNAQLRMDSLAVFDGEKIIGFIDDEQAQLYNILIGNHKRYIFNTVVDDEYYFATEIVTTKTKIKTELENNKAFITVDLSALIVENAYNIDLTKQDNLNTMAEYLTNKLTRDFKEFIYVLQHEFKADIIGIGGKAYYQNNRLWEEKQGYWDELFPELDIYVELNFVIDSVGEVGNVSL